MWKYQQLSMLISNTNFKSKDINSNQHITISRKNINFTVNHQFTHVLQRKSNQSSKILSANWYTPLPKNFPPIWQPPKKFTWVSSLTIIFQQFSHQTRSSLNCSASKSYWLARRCRATNWCQYGLTIRDFELITARVSEKLWRVVWRAQPLHVRGLG